MQPVASIATPTKRGILIHDGLAFLILLAVSLGLLGVTLFLFKSFDSHREDLAVRWSQRGRVALEQNKPAEAVGALRAALNYAPDDRADQLLLAQALASAGHVDEATNYFLNLWSTRPGDGFINLQLARLARTRGNNRDATDYYRASVFGSWEGDGVLRRREVRLELADFLIAQHENAEARNELFTVAGNSPDNPNLNLTVASKLMASGYVADALTFYRKAITADPHARAPLAAAGQAAYALDDYGQAERYLERALEAKGDSDNQEALGALLQNARRLQQLSLVPDQPSRRRASHILAAASIAQARLEACVSPTAPKLADLTTRWASADALRKTLADNSDIQDTWVALIYQTELDSAKTCGAPSGDDALLLRLANTAAKEASNGNN